MKLFRKIFFVFLIFSFDSTLSANCNINTVLEILTGRKEYCEPVEIREKAQELKDAKKIINENDLKRTINNFINLVQEQIKDINLNMLFVPESISSRYEKKDESYIQKIVVEDDDKVIVMGDFHGSVHSLCRNLLNLIDMGYLNENLKLKDKIYLVCTGDYVDRGLYSIEVLYLLMNLKIKNPNRVVLLRGNHETNRLATCFGFLDEIIGKYLNMVITIEDFIAVFKYLPLALFIGKDDDFIMCCHGGLPVNIKGIAYDEQFWRNVKDFLSENIFFKKLEGFGPDLTWGDFEFNSQFRRVSFQRSEGRNNGSRIFLKSIIDRGQLPQIDGQSIIKTIFRAHQHNNNSIGIPGRNCWEKAGDVGIPFNVSKSIIYTFMSCPDGYGGYDESRFDLCNVDGFGTLEIKNGFDSWTLTQYERQLPEDRHIKFVHIDVENNKLKYEWKDEVQSDFGKVKEFLNPRPKDIVSQVADTAQEFWEGLKDLIRLPKKQPVR